MKSPECDDCGGMRDPPHNAAVMHFLLVGRTLDATLAWLLSAEVDESTIAADVPTRRKVMHITLEDVFIFLQLFPVQ